MPELSQEAAEEGEAEALHRGGQGGPKHVEAPPEAPGEGTLSWLGAPRTGGCPRSTEQHLGQWRKKGAGPGARLKECVQDAAAPHKRSRLIGRIIYEVTCITMQI